jgi:hypothetical protein
MFARMPSLVISASPGAKPSSRLRIILISTSVGIGRTNHVFLPGSIYLLLRITSSNVKFQKDMGISDDPDI